MTVYVTQENQHNYVAAEQFGQVEFLTRDDLNNLKGSLHNEHVLLQIRAKLIKFDPEQDWIVVTGSPYISAAVFMILGSKHIRTVRVLRWDNRSRSYAPMFIELPAEHKTHE